jgi:archaellum component FlaC
MRRVETIIEEHIEDLQTRFNCLQDEIKAKKDQIEMASNELEILEIKTDYCQGEFKALIKMKEAIEQETPIEVTIDTNIEDQVEEASEPVAECSNHRKSRFGSK